MKKILIATTALVATAGVAAADVTLSGYGRFGADYNGTGKIDAAGGLRTEAVRAALAAGSTSAQADAAGDLAAADTPSTQVNGRVRINIDAATETDSGVKFGARIRIQHSTNGTAANLNAAKMYAEFAGARMEVGNTETAIDSAKLMYNSEIGYLNRSFGNPIGGFAAYESSAYGDQERMGVFGSYAFGAGNVRLSMINPNQTRDANRRTEKTEVSLSADYAFGQFTVSGAFADNAGTVDGNTSLFLGAEYAVMPNANVGILHFRDKTAAVTASAAAVSPAVDAVRKSSRERTTIYGNYAMDAYTFRGYVADDNGAGNLTDTSFGLGLDYAMGGGTRLSADIHRNYVKDVVAGVGVRFNF
jgi:outer membrane protein OmpU